MFKQLLVNEPWGTEREVVERYCSEAGKFGATAVIVNRLPDNFHPGLIEDPTNLYPKFFNWGPSLDMFFSTDLNREVWPEELLTRNRKALLRTCEIARKHGLKPTLLLGEPRYQPERFFQKNPHLRGPRVDNPNTSSVAYFAPCVSAPEVKEHYRELMTKMVRAIPDLDGMIFYNGDSGTGICHSEGLYAGPNGSRFCEKIPPGQKLLSFLTLLLEAAQAIQPDFKIWMYLYIHAKEREYVLEHSGGNISFVAAGSFVGGSSFEDPFATVRYGAEIDQVGYEKAFEERLHMMRESMEKARRMGKVELEECTLPVEQWMMPLRTVPYPFQVMQILDGLKSIEAKNVFFYGIFNDPAVVPFEANRRILQLYRLHPDRSPEAIVRALAEEWATAGHAEALTEAWRLCDRAYRLRPIWAWGFGYQRNFFPGPLVPDPFGLSVEERSYYYTAGEANKDRIPGSDFRNALRYDETTRDWMLDRYESHAIHFTNEALGLLRKEMDRVKGNEARACLISQMRQIGAFAWWLRAQRNWLEAGRFFAPGTGQVKLERSMREIMDDEIENTESLKTLADGHVEELFSDSWNPVYSFNTDFMEALDKRIALMKAHRDDAVSPCALPEQL